MSEKSEAKQELERYKPLGLIANPFVWSSRDSRPGLDTEIVSESNRLMSAIISASLAEQGRPIRLDKTTDIPPYYPSRAISEVEHRLIHDDSLSVLHAYTQLFMMRRGRIRPTLAALGERLAFQAVDKTIAAYVAHVVAEPNESLASYQVLGAEKLAAFAEEFEAAPLETVNTYFGTTELERQPDLDSVADMRLGTLEPDVDEEADPDEIGDNLGAALGTEGAVLPPETDEEEPVDEKDMVVDYIIEYAGVELSPVIARALRVFRDRGIAAMSVEFRVTNAPKKTLAALIRFARYRYRKIVLIYDGFDSWPSVPQDLRYKISTTLSEIRWQFADDAVVVAMLDRDLEPELEEAFAAATHVPWDFAGVIGLRPETELQPHFVDRWFAAATLEGATPLSSADPVIAKLIEAAAGNVDGFVGMARAAVESAADRRVSSLDDVALEAGLAAAQEV